MGEVLIMLQGIYAPVAELTLSSLRGIYSPERELRQGV